MSDIKIPGDYKYISAFLTMRCNLKCSYCLNNFNTAFDRASFKELHGREWVKSINRINSCPEVPITFSGGEPFLHPDFIEIINGVKSELNIDILTNLLWGKKGIERFLSEVDPERIKRSANYPSIRVSYHPEQMGEGEVLVENVKRLKDAGFSIGIYSVQYPSPRQLEAITQMQFRCRDSQIDFRIKDFTGKFEGVDDLGRPFSIIYGDYSKYPDSAFQNKTRNCDCKTSEFLIGPNGNIYRCHRDLYSEEFTIGNIADSKFQIEEGFKSCDKYGECHPCDVKTKTNYQQQFGHSSVEIKNIK
ncbi:MAG: radical SAM protein [Nanoarchaeota archaeon]